MGKIYFIALLLLSVACNAVIAGPELGDVRTTEPAGTREALPTQEPAVIPEEIITQEEEAIREYKPQEPAGIPEEIITQEPGVIPKNILKRILEAISTPEPATRREARPTETIPKIPADYPFGQQCGSDQECPSNYQCKAGKCVPLPEEAKGPAEAAEQPAEPSTGEIFVGPLAGWKNVKDYGAVGDGQTDDTQKIQAALNGLQNREFHVLYFPAGTYKITETLTFSGKDTEKLVNGKIVDENNKVVNQLVGGKIVGEDPATTKLVWYGPEGDSLIYYNPNHFIIGRLTLDGKGKAGRLIEHGKKFSAWTEYFDLILKDAGICIEAGKMDGFGISDTVVARSTFLRCSKAGILISNPNTLEWEIYDSLFKDNHVAITTGIINPDPNLELKGAGNFHVYQSVFQNSKLADIIMGGGFYTIRDSVSINSNTFHASYFGTYPSQLTLQNNLIIDPRLEVPIKHLESCAKSPICIGHRGPVIMLDNVIRSKENQFNQLYPVVKDIGAIGAFISIGNKYTVKDWFEGHPSGKSKLKSIDDKIVFANRISNPVIQLPAIPPRKDVQIFELSPGASTEEIQKAIDAASKLKQAVVHLQAGKHFITKTLVIPANTDLQLIGDGRLRATELEWKGKGEGPVIRVDGPSKVSLREFFIKAQDGSKEPVDGIVITNSDQLGGRIRTNQVTAMFGKVNFLVDQLKNVNLEFLSSGPSSAEMGYKIVGSGDAQDVLILGEGGLGDITYYVEDSRVLVRDPWGESRVWETPNHILLKGKTTFTLHNARNDHPRSTLSEDRTIIVDNVEGKASFIGLVSTPSDLKDSRKPKDIVLPDSVLNADSNKEPLIEVRGKDSKVALIGSTSRGANFIGPQPAQVSRIYTYVTTSTGPGSFTTALQDDFGPSDDNYILDMFEQARSVNKPLSYKPTPLGTSDLFLYRVEVRNANNAFVFTPSFCGNAITEEGESCDDGKAGICDYGEESCQICSSQCDGSISGQTSYCGDNSCDLNLESTDNCQQDCGLACSTDNLIGWWSGEGNANDVLKNNHGKLNGDTSFTSGKVGQALSFGGEGFVETNNGRVFTALTFAAWVKPQLAGGHSTILGNAGNGLGHSWSLTPEGKGTLHLGGIKHGNNSFQSIPYDLVKDQWAHIAVSWDKTGFKAYKNGLEVGNGKTEISEVVWGNVPGEDRAFVIGTSRAVGPLHNFSGEIDELAIWESELTPSEVKAIYDAGEKGKCQL